MKKIIIKAILFPLIIIPLLCHGWNYTGHVVIAQIAYDQLDSIKKQKADDLANLIISQLPANQREKLDRSFNNASTFAKVAALPDVWKKWNVSTLFIKFHAIPALNLMLSWNQSTAEWHYIDTPYPSNTNCNTVSSNNVIWAIDSLSQNFSKAKVPTTKALNMVLLTHYVGDIHQPLHTMTNVSQSCDGDRGGNNFCLKENANGKCTKNLHSLWDSGIGYLKPHGNIRSLALDIENNYPKIQFTNILTNRSAKLWSDESYTFSYKVYNTSSLMKPSSTYYQNGQSIAKSQIALAGYRLSDILQKVL